MAKQKLANIGSTPIETKRLMVEKNKLPHSAVLNHTVPYELTPLYRIQETRYRIVVTHEDYDTMIKLCKSNGQTFTAFKRKDGVITSMRTYRHDIDTVEEF